MGLGPEEMYFVFQMETGCEGFTLFFQGAASCNDKQCIYILHCLNEIDGSLFLGQTAYEEDYFFLSLRKIVFHTVGRCKVRGIATHRYYLCICISVDGF